MKKISGSTFYFKKLFPTIWFGFIAFFFVISITTGAAGASVMFLVVPIIMAGFGYFFFRKFVWDLADEVYDCGDFLEFRRGQKTQRVSLNEIINIDYSHMSSPERVVIHTRQSGAIGKELAFCPPMRFHLFSKSPLVRDLIERVDAARRT
ncbi:MAG: hypothetical protein CVU54_08525 [Deltaproteobacteria bacterium HGW-Deltaproteobacteria-12]|jgi:hypothetical protein|nr:MAG: hypothetical protein CVU54_08525 [Deltaproteobacteria bacterium HGW-Deltaproteobacteria-12]